LFRCFFFHLVTIIEVLPKEKKQKEEKTAALSQCSVDLFPLFHAAQPLTYTFDLHSIIPTDANVDLSKVRRFFVVDHRSVYEIILGVFL